MNHLTSAKIDLELLGRMITMLDVTLLSDQISSHDLENFCANIRSSPVSVAAVCLPISSLYTARQLLGPDVALATVVNFPSGRLSPKEVLAELEQALMLGSNEIDYVLNYRLLQRGEVEQVQEELARAIAYAGKEVVFKVIIESGELEESDLVELATKLVINAGANFVKTSTGKTRHGASIKHVKIMLDAINHSCASPEDRIGIKVSGGVRMLEDAFCYLRLMESNNKNQPIDHMRFRIGASSLFDVILSEFKLQLETNIY